MLSDGLGERGGAKRAEEAGLEGALCYTAPCAQVDEAGQDAGCAEFAHSPSEPGEREPAPKRVVQSLLQRVRWRARCQIDQGARERGDRDPIADGYVDLLQRARPVHYVVVRALALARNDQLDDSGCK